MTKIVDISRRRFKKAKELFLPVEERIEMNRNLYYGKMNTDEYYEWDYSLADQQVFPLIRNYISRTNLAHLEVSLEARKPSDWEKKDINQKFINWELNEFHKTMELIKMLFSAFVAGRGILKTGWLYSPRVKINVDGKKQIVMRDITNRADAKFVRYNNVIPGDLNIPSLLDQREIFEIVQKRVGDMLDENEQEEYWDTKFIEWLRKSAITNKALDFQLERIKDEDLQNDIIFRSATVNLVCMRTLDGDEIYFPLDESGWEKPVNLIQENRFWHGHYPFLDFAVFPEDDRYDSMSVVDAVADLQIAATEILNQTLTNIRQANNMTWVLGAAAASTPDWVFINRPNNVIKLDGDISQVEQMRPIDNAGTGLRISQELQNKIEKNGGISSLYSSGVPGAKINQTARGAQIIDQNIETNMQLLVDMMGETVVKGLAEHFLELNAQYVTEEQTFAVTGKSNTRDLISISPEQISANFDVYANTDKFAKQTPASRQASLQNMITQLLNIQNQDQMDIDLVPLINAYIESHPDTQNIGEVVVGIDEKFQRDSSSIARGQLPEIKVRDAHQELIQLASIHLQENTYPEEIIAVWEKYIQKHMAFIQSQREIQAMTQPQIPQAQSPEMLMGGGQGGGVIPETTGEPEPNMGTYNLGEIA